MTRTHVFRPGAGRLAAALGVVLAALMSIAAPALAQQGAGQPVPGPDPDAVVATVGDQTITEADLSFAAEDLGQELANIPPEQRRAFLVTVLIDMKVMAAAARDAGMDASQVYKRRLAYLEDRALRRAYFAEKISTAVTAEAVQAAYNDYVSSFQPQEEVRASHILVATEADAQAIEEELAQGASFEQLAKEKSMDPSGAQTGGDLGYFTRGMMVKPFEDAAFALDVGQVSQPVQSQFGWHIIKLVDKRQSSPPPLEQVASQLQQQILFQHFDETVGALKEKTPITIPDAALAEEVRKQSESGQSE